MFHDFAGATADQVWRLAARTLTEDKTLPWQDSRSGRTKEILRATFTVQDSRQRWVLSRMPILNPAFALAEVIWILNGMDEADFLNYFNGNLPKFAGNVSRYHGAYGYRLRKHRQIDQLQRAYQALKNNSDTRQVVLQIWDSPVDLPDEQGRPVASDIPCNLISCLNIRQGKLEWLQVLRSNDIFLGLPYNLVQFTTLQEVMAGWLGIEPSSYNHISNSLHVYEHNIGKFSLSTQSNELRNNDSLALPKAESDLVFRELASATKEIISSGLSSEQLSKRARSTVMPDGYKNILLILTSEGIRRRGAIDQARELTHDCSNPALRYAMHQWIEVCAAKQR